MQSEKLDELRDLVLAAFEAAKRSGNPGWRTMTPAVLKNRLLQLTDRRFAERDYGVTSIRNLLELVPDIVDITRNERGAVVVRLLSSAEAHDAVALSSARTSRPGGDADSSGNLRHMRIREDLWRALMYVSPDSYYVLDSETGIARPKELSDAGEPLLPVITGDRISHWRRDFVESLSGVGDAVAVDDDLGSWVTSGDHDHLPRALRGRWAGYLKNCVYEELLSWFKDRQCDIPADLLVPTPPKVVSSTTPAEVGEVVETRRLRQQILRVVDNMTYDELSALNLPAGAVMRTLGPGG